MPKGAQEEEIAQLAGVGSGLLGMDHCQAERSANTGHTSALFISCICLENMEGRLSNELGKRSQKKSRVQWLAKSIFKKIFSN